MPNGSYLLSDSLVPDLPFSGRLFGSLCRLSNGIWLYVGGIDPNQSANWADWNIYKFDEENDSEWSILIDYRTLDTTVDYSTAYHPHKFILYEVPGGILHVGHPFTFNSALGLRTDFPAQNLLSRRRLILVDEIKNQSISVTGATVALHNLVKFDDACLPLPLISYVHGLPGTAQFPQITGHTANRVGILYDHYFFGDYLLSCLIGIPDMSYTVPNADCTPSDKTGYLPIVRWCYNIYPPPPYIDSALINPPDLFPCTEAMTTDYSLPYPLVLTTELDRLDNINYLAIIPINNAQESIVLCNANISGYFNHCWRVNDSGVATPLPDYPSTLNQTNSGQYITFTQFVTAQIANKLFLIGGIFQNSSAPQWGSNFFILDLDTNTWSTSSFNTSLPVVTMCSTPQAIRNRSFVVGGMAGKAPKLNVLEENSNSQMPSPSNKIYEFGYFLKSPTGVTCSYDKVSGAVTISWTIQSDDQDFFAVYMSIDDGDYALIGTTPSSPFKYKIAINLLSRGIRYKVRAIKTTI